MTAMLQQQQAAHNTKKLESLLITPVQRIPRYALLLRVRANID